MSTLILLAALATNPVPTGFVVDRVDEIELHTQTEYCYHRDEWVDSYSQYIFWDNYPRGHKLAGQKYCVDYRIVRPSVMSWPERDYARGGWVLLWNDHGIYRAVRAPLFTQDASSSDPELADRERLLLDRRRKLTPK